MMTAASLPTDVSRPPSTCARPTRHPTRWACNVYLDHGQVTLDCKILEIDPAHRLIHTFTMAYDPEAAAERPSRVT